MMKRSRRKRSLTDDEGAKKLLEQALEKLKIYTCLSPRIKGGEYAHASGVNNLEEQLTREPVL
jgi:hypothetical protein